MEVKPLKDKIRPVTSDTIARNSLMSFLKEVILKTFNIIDFS